MTRTAMKELARPTRVSVREQRNQLNVTGLDTKNFYYRWVNEIDDRLAKFLRAGYEFVQSSEIDSIGDPTVETSQGTDSRVCKGVGGGRKAWLMKLPMEFRKEYDAEKEADILETERAMRRSKLQSHHEAAQDAEIVDVRISSNRGRERV